MGTNGRLDGHDKLTKRIECNFQLAVARDAGGEPEASPLLCNTDVHPHRLSTHSQLETLLPHEYQQQHQHQHQHQHQLRPITAIFCIFRIFRKLLKINILTHFWLPGVPESNSASKIIWVHRSKSIFSQNSKIRLCHKISFSLITLPWRA